MCVGGGGDPVTTETPRDRVFSQIALSDPHCSGRIQICPCGIPEMAVTLSSGGPGVRGQGDTLP